MKFLCAVVGGLDQRKSFFLLSFFFFLAHVVWRLQCRISAGQFGGEGVAGLDWSGLVVGLWWACVGLRWALVGFWWALVVFDGLRWALVSFSGL